MFSARRRAGAGGERAGEVLPHDTYEHVRQAPPPQDRKNYTKNNKNRNKNRNTNRNTNRNNFGELISDDRTRNPTDSTPRIFPESEKAPVAGGIVGN